MYSKFGVHLTVPKTQDGPLMETLCTEYSQTVPVRQHKATLEWA